MPLTKWVLWPCSRRCLG